MKTHTLIGSKQEIAEGLARITGDVREAIVFVEEQVSTASDVGTLDAENAFAEMGPYMIDVQGVDDSREAIYTRTVRE